MAKEQILQIRIKNYLRANGWRVIKTISLSENGHPDLFCFKSGVTMVIEVKSKGKKPSVLQLYRLDEWVKDGFIAFWTDSFDDFKNIIYIKNLTI